MGMKSWLHRRRLRSQHADTSFPEQTSTTNLAPTKTSGTLLTSDIAGHVDKAEDWAKQTESSFLACSSIKSIDHCAKAEEELACIERKARQPEDVMLRHEAKHVTPKDSTAPTTPKSTDLHMAGRTERPSITKPRVIAPDTVRTRSVSDVTDARQRERQPAIPRRTMSSGALQDELYMTALKGRGKLPNPKSPHECLHCKRAFSTLATAQKTHPTCTVWSCKFLPGIQYAIYPIESNGELEALCCYCNESLGQGQQGRVKSNVLKAHMKQHNFRNCDQSLFHSGQCFRQHLQDDHKAVNDGTLFAAWMLLVKSCQKQRPSFFKQLESSPAALRLYTDPAPASNTEPAPDTSPVTPSSFMDFTEITIRPEPKKLRRKRSVVTRPETPSKKSDDNLSRTTTIPSVPPLPQTHLVYTPPPTSKPDALIHRPTAGGVSADFAFYRRRIDASTRNRLYLHDCEEPLSESSQQRFRRIPVSVLGVLILHSSLVAAVPVRMTNSVDIYWLN